MKRTKPAPDDQSLFGFGNDELADEVSVTVPVDVTVSETMQPLPPEPLSVSALTQQLKYVLEPQFQNVLVVGEVSRPSPSNGHLYFALKDDDAVLNTCVWRSKLQRVKFNIHDGLEVICRGKIEIYDKRGSYSLIVESIEPKGIGSLELAFRQLHERLSAEGLFDERRKRPLPKFPRNVALITAEHKAAANDFIRVLGNRTQRVDVLFVPTKVQGEGAAAGIANAIKRVNALAETGVIRAEVIVITRGGGSKEDLWTFNEETVVRAVATSAIPVISAVGHEIDVSLCDLAADLRAFTPSNAAELITQPDSELISVFTYYNNQLNSQIENQYHTRKQRLEAIKNHRAFTQPESIIQQRINSVTNIKEKLNNIIESRLENAINQLSKHAAKLEALSPLAVLARGWSLTTNASGKIIRNKSQVKTGETITTRVQDGVFTSVVQQQTEA